MSACCEPGEELLATFPGPDVIALAGNPNCGKTTLFNALTGARQKVGNWPGVTVEKKQGSYIHADRAVTVIDLPGIYSLATPANAPLDETVARRFILDREARLIINIVDASNLERNLYLTAQLAEMGLPMVVVLNMMDAAKDDGLTIDVERLRASLGCPVVPLVARRAEGVVALRSIIERALAEGVRPCARPSFPPLFEAALRRLHPLIEDSAQTQALDPRWLATRLLEGDTSSSRGLPPAARAAAAEARAAILAETGEEPAMLAADARFGFAHELVRQAVSHDRRASATLTDRTDRVVLNRWLGLPIFLAILYVVFLLSINVAGVFVDFFDQATGALFVDGPAHLLAGLGLPAVVTMLIRAVGAGLQTVSTFIPIVGILFLCLTALEDSGYMARAAFVMDRSMRTLGLPGKAFLPLILGFGCTVPAVMSTRTLETRDDRLLATAMAPFMSCGARLPVYALFAAAFFSTGGQNVVFGLYLLGITVAVLTGLALKSTLLRSEPVSFIMELPHYHLPTLKGLALGMWERLRGFIVDAGKIIVIVVAVLNVFNTIGTDGSLGNEANGRSLLATVSKTLTPVMAPMGISEDNWPATVGLFTGIFAKEAVVGTLDTLYSTLAGDSGGTDEAFSFTAAMTQAFATIPENAAALAGQVLDPLGFSVLADSAAEAQGVARATFSAMQDRFDGKMGALAYLVFILLYVPCSAAMSAIQRETGTRWALFVVAWSMGLAYGAAVLIYQAANFSRQPATALVWLIIIPLALAAALALLRRQGNRRATEASPAAEGRPEAAE